MQVVPVNNMDFLASGQKVWHLFPELVRIGESSFLHVTPLSPKGKEKTQTSEQGNSKREARDVYRLLCYGIWGKNRLRKYRCHELQHCLLAAGGRGTLWQAPLATSPPRRAGAFLWVPFPFPKTVTEHRKIWKGLNKSCAVNQLGRRRRSESEHVKQGEGE